MKTKHAAAGLSNPTIKDIANALGVSHSTVSRALNDQRHISKDMKRRVRQAASELGYIVNAGARTLRQANSTLIGLIAPDVMSELFAVMTKVLALRCARAGYQLVVNITEDDAAVELAHVKALRQSRALGVIIIPTPDMLPETAELLGPTCVVQFSRSHELLQAPSVSIDGVSGVSSAVHHLAEIGHRRIGFDSLSSDRSTGLGRMRGFMEGMAAHGLTVEPGLVRQGPGTAEFGRAMTAALLQRQDRPSAIVFGTADLTQGGVEALRKSSLAIPGDISVVGFGDPAWFRLLTPPLSTVGLTLGESAEAAISMLLRQIEAKEEGRPLDPQASLETEPYLILRGTTAPPAKTA
jgi:LacI family transcriptional regulator